MATQAELRNKVLEKLSVIEPGGTAETGDANSVDDAIDSFYHWLLSNHYATWASADDIPTWAVLPMTEVLAMRMAPDFGKPYVDWEPYAHRQFGLLTRMDAHNEPTAAEYF